MKTNAKRLTPAMARKSIAMSLGQQYDGGRDIYEQAGYIKDVPFSEYYGAYRRGDIAARLVEEPVASAWRGNPKVLDGETIEDATSDTPFAQAWRELVAGRQDVENEILGVYHYLRDVDIQSGIGQFGCVFLGVNDGDVVAEEPILPKSVIGFDGLLYLTVFNEGQIVIKTFDKNPKSPRFDLPLLYSLETESGTESVHWSRILHVGSDAYGTFGYPRLEKVLNRLFDKEKVMAANGESAWRLMVNALALTAREGYQIGAAENDTTLADEASDFIHGLTRIIDLEGVDIQEFSGAILDPSGSLAAIVRLISAATKIPQRLLLGAEAGELASTQDESNWNDVIEDRRKNFVEPVILKRFINRMIYFGVLPEPTRGIIVKWPPLETMNDLDMSTLGNASADAMNKLGVEPDILDFITAYFPGLDASKVAKKEVQEMTFGTPPPDTGVDDDFTAYP